MVYGQCIQLLRQLNVNKHLCIFSGPPGLCTILQDWFLYISSVEDFYFMCRDRDVVWPHCCMTVPLALPVLAVIPH